MAFYIIAALDICRCNICFCSGGALKQLEDDLFFLSTRDVTMMFLNLKFYRCRDLYLLESSRPPEPLQ